MPRKGPAPRREILPDPVYHNVLVARFINRLFIDGKKSVGERIFYGALDQIRDRSGKDPVEIFEQAVRNTMPAVEVKSRRVGGSTYQVPVEVRPARRETLAIRWLITNARRRGGRTMVDERAGVRGTDRRYAGARRTVGRRRAERDGADRRKRR